MEEFTPREIAHALHLLRHAKGWTLRELERASGIALNTICAYKSRRRRPPLAAVERLLIAVGCFGSWPPAMGRQPAGEGRRPEVGVVLSHGLSIRAPYLRRLRA